jgi:hypothetical protein
VATDENSENDRTRIETSSGGNVSMRAKEDEPSTGCIWAAGFHHVLACSRLAHILKLMNRVFL